MIYFPNGYIIETELKENSFYVYGELNSNGFIAKGFQLEVPNLSNANWVQKNELCTNLQSYLARFDTSKRVQWRYRKDTNYRKILEKYDEDTANFVDVTFAQEFRKQISANFKNQIENHELHREYLTIYISRPMKDFIIGALDINSKKEMKLFQDRVSNYFESEYLLLKSAFSFPIHKLDNIQLFTEIFCSTNKSLATADIHYNKVFTPNFVDIFRNEFSSQDHSEKIREKESVAERHYGMYGDGMYHNILTLTQLPNFDLTPFYGNIFLETNVVNFSITSNMKPLNKPKTIEKLESRQAAAQRDLEADPSAIAYKSEVDALGKTIYRMGAGEDCPFEVEYIIHIWNRNLDQLQQDTEQIRLVATNLQCNMMMHDLTVQIEAQFLKTLPGNLYYKKWDSLFVLHRSFAAMIPFNSTFVGCEDDFQALFHGDHHNIICTNGFYGNSPQHAAVFGQTGAGKSVNVLGELLQIYPFYSKMVIIEEGASYLMFTRIFGGEFIEIDLNNNLTLNYFDTCGSILTANQTDFATNFATIMCGQSTDDEVIQDRMAIISHYVIKMYEASWQEWWNHNIDLRSEIAKIAITIEWMLSQQLAGNNTQFDCYLELKEALSKDAEKHTVIEQNFLNFYNNIVNDKITEYIVENNPLLRDISYAYMKGYDIPYHSQLVEMIRSTPDPSHNRNDTNRIATRLAQYAIESGRGCLFDGVTNIDLSSRLLHFEIGKMANASANIRAMVGMVISNLAQQQIINMPRTLKKMFIFEEMPRIIATIPGASSFAKRSYAQLRKSNCRSLTITQEAGQLSDGDLGTIIMSQSKQYYFLRNKDKGNMEYFRRFANLSDDTVNSIMTFPSPEHIAGKKYSSFVYYVDNGEFPLIGVVRHYANSLTIAIASTSGEAFTKREEELRKLRLLYPNLDEGQLLIEYENRQKIDNNALRLVKKIMYEKDFSQIGKLHEEIVLLSKLIKGN